MTALWGWVEGVVGWYLLHGDFAAEFLGCRDERSFCTILLEFLLGRDVVIRCSSFFLDFFFLFLGSDVELIDFAEGFDVRGILNFHVGNDAEHADAFAQAELEGFVEARSLRNFSESFLFDLDEALHSPAGTLEEGFSDFTAVHGQRFTEHFTGDVRQRLGEFDGGLAVVGEEEEFAEFDTLGRVDIKAAVGTGRTADTTGRRDDEVEDIIFSACPFVAIGTVADAVAAVVGVVDEHIEAEELTDFKEDAFVTAIGLVASNLGAIDEFNFLDTNLVFKQELDAGDVFGGDVLGNILDDILPSMGDSGTPRDAAGLGDTEVEVFGELGSKHFLGDVAAKVDGTFTGFDSGALFLLGPFVVKNLQSARVEGELRSVVVATFLTNDEFF